MTAMLKFTSRHALWSRTIWTLYVLIGITLFLTDTLSQGTTVWAQVFLYAGLSLPSYNKRVERWLDTPRREILRMQGRIFTA